MVMRSVESFMEVPFKVVDDVEFDARPLTKDEEVDRVTAVVETTTKTLISALAVLERLQRQA